MKLPQKLSTQDISEKVCIELLGAMFGQTKMEYPLIYIVIGSQIAM